MNALEVLEVATAIGANLTLDDEGQLIIEVDDGAPRLPLAVREGLKVHRDQLRAVLKLRLVHASMGYSPKDVLFIERALLSGEVSSIRIAARPPVGVTA